MSISLINIILDEEDKLMSSWPIVLSGNQSQHAFVSIDQQVDDVEMVVHEGTLKFSSEALSYFFFKSVDAIVVLGLVFIVTIILKRIIHTLNQQNPFCIENTLRIKYIGIAILLVMPYKLLKSYIYIHFIKNNISPPDGMQFVFFDFGLNSYRAFNEIVLMVDLDFEPIFIGLLLIISAKVFQIGLDLKKDSESIV